MNVGVAVGLVLLGAALGAAVMWFVMRALAGAHSAAQLAAAETERDVLRERVVDLEATVSDDAQTAALLRPLGDTLTRVERQVAVLERDRVEQFGDVGATLKSVAQSTEALRQETASLAGSLRSSGVRGTWGETQLRRVLESSGMLRHTDFSEQFRGQADSGNDVRPDVVVHLPHERSIVIDAKAPLTAFLQAQGDDVDPQQRDGLIRQHARQLRGHMETLAHKRYWTALPNSPELVICFVPGDAILAQALLADPELLTDGFARNVVVASPSTLMATLRTVAHLWNQSTLEDNARDLLALGRELYDRIGVVGKHTHDLGNALRRSVESYNLFVGSLENRVLVTARKMQELGLSSTPPPEVRRVEASPRPLTHEALLADALNDDAPSR